MPRLVYSEELPDTLDAGGIGIGGQRSGAKTDLLQMVIFQNSRGIRGNEQLTISAATTRAMPSTNLEAAHEYIAPLIEFARLELGVDLPTRSVACLVDAVDETVFPVAGAYCPVTADQVGAEIRNRGKPRGVLTSLSSAWLGGGTRLWGDNAAELTLALGAALGLRWLQASGNETALQNALRAARDGVAAAERTGEWNITDVTRSIQLSMYQGMQSVQTRRGIGGFIRDHWGMYVPQERFVDMLRAVGTSVPNVFM
jgi:hypothetical protein